MKNLILSALILLGFIGDVSAQTFYTWRQRIHATSCNSLTDGLSGDICEQDSDSTLWYCQPTAGVNGTCTTSGEWHQVGGSSTNAAADGSTKGIASFTATDFDSSSGNISLDYANGQKATGSLPGFLSAADWTTFNAKTSSQWATQNTNDVSLAGGNVGVGTTMTTTAALTVMNGNVGIGTWKPTQILNIIGTPLIKAADVTLSSGNAGMFIYSNDAQAVDKGGSLGLGGNVTTGATNTQIFGYIGGKKSTSSSGGTSGYMSFGTSNSGTVTEAMRIDNAQNIGIGTTIASGALVVMSGNVGIGTWVPVNLVDVKGNMVIGSYAGISANVAPANGLSVSGNVSVGTFTSARALTIFGNSTNNAGLEILNAGTGGRKWDFLSMGNAGTIGSSGLALFDGTASLTRIFIDANGNIGMGTFLPVNKLVVHGNGSTNASIGYASAVAPNAGLLVAGNVGIATFLNTNVLDVAGAVAIGATNAGYITAPSNGLIVQGNVGIGTYAVDRGMLSVKQTADTNSGGITVLNSTATGSTRWWIDNNNRLYIDSGSGGSNPLVLNGAGLAGGNTGNVGIGTLNPQAAFHFTPAGSSSTPFIITSSGNVGIGSLTPGQLLDVAGNIRNRGTNEHYFGDDNVAGILASATTTPDIKFMNNSTETMRLTNGNNVGIGTTTPQGALVVMNGNVGIGTWATQNLLDIKGNVSVGTFGAVYPAPSGGMIISSNVGIGTFAPAGRLIVRGGNVGIGVNAPSQSLEIAGGLATTGTIFTDALRPNSGNQLQIGNGGSNYVYINNNIGVGTTTVQARLVVMGGNVGIGTWSSDNARLTILGGNVGVGTANPNRVLSVIGNIGIGTTDTNLYNLKVNGNITQDHEYSYGTNIGIGTTAIDWNNGNYQNIGIGTSTGAYIAFTHPTAGIGTLHLRILEDATGSRAIIGWPTTVLWSGGTAPTLSGANKSDYIHCTWNGVNDFCAPTQNF